MGTQGFITITVAVLLAFAVPSCQGSGGAIDGIDLPGTDLSVVANDQWSTDLSCTPQCKDKECGDDGCGGSCGECSGAKPYCSEGVCVPECAAKAPVVNGWVKNSVNDMDFTGEPVDVQLFHKLDIDKVEDGCISKYVIAMSKVGLGCHFSIQLETDSDGYFGVTDAVLKADSFCPGWLDSDEGEYRLYESTLVVCSNVEVTDYMVESTCIPDVSLSFSGLLTLKRLGDGKLLDVDLSELQVVGDMISTGFTELTCPDLCAGKDCGGDGCGGSCGNGLCQMCNGDGHCLKPWWTDPASNLTWNNPPDGSYGTWSEAKQHCFGLSLVGGGWHLPTIGELRTLVRGCPGTVTGGACGVTDTCLSSSCASSPCWSCSAWGGPAEGCYWPGEMLGKCEWYWSSSAVDNASGKAWAFNFYGGFVEGADINNGGGHILCVK